VSKKLGAEIIRLWVASTDYSGDIAGDDKILARVVDAYRRIRNTLRFLLANTSDFDPATDAVPAEQMLEIDRYALARAAQLQAEILAHYEVYEFHPVVAKLQVYCSEDLGGFYLDVLKDRLYTTAPKSLARRRPRPRCGRSPRPCCAGWRPSCLHRRGGLEGVATESIFLETFWNFGAADEALLAKWAHPRRRDWSTRRSRPCARPAGGPRCRPKSADRAPAKRAAALLQSLGDDLKFVFITSAARLVAPPSPAPASAPRSRQVRALLALPRRRGRNPATRRCAAAATATCTAPAKAGASPDGRRLRQERAAPRARAGGGAARGPAALAGLGADRADRRPVHQDADPRLLPAARQHDGAELLQHRARPQHRRGLLLHGHASAGSAGCSPASAWPRPASSSGSCASTAASACSPSRWPASSAAPSAMWWTA
jgi:hypothetical protein